MKKTVFWIDEYPRPTGITSDLPSQADVVVIGSGLTGISAALRLAEGGRTVAIVEANEIASGASSMNGGMVSPDVKAGVDLVYEKHGPEVGLEMWQSTIRSIEIVEELTRKYDVDASISHGGMAGLGWNDAHYSSYRKTVAWYRENLGVEWEILGPDRVGEVVGGTDKFTCAMLEPEGFGVQPARLVFGLAKAAHTLGIALVDHCRALSVEGRGAGFTVATSRGSIDAGEVVVATNGYTTTAPIPDLASKIVSVGSYIITTEPLPESEAEVFFPQNSMTYTPKRLLNYMRRTPDNRILIGGRRNLHPGLDPNESAADLRNRLVEFWPALKTKKISHVWGGRLGVPFDLIPHIGQIDGVWYAMGYAGHGVGLSTQLGYELAGTILGEDPPSVYTKIPYRGRWYYRKRPWFLTAASLAYRSLDLIDK